MASLILPIACPARKALVVKDPVCVACNGSAWAVGHGDGAIYINTPENRVCKALIGHQRPITSLMFIAQYQIEDVVDCPALVSVDCGGTIAIWSLLDGRCLLFHSADILSGPVGAVLVNKLIVCAETDKLAFFHQSSLEIVSLVTASDLLMIAGYRASSQHYIVGLLKSHKLVGWRVEQSRVVEVDIYDVLGVGDVLASFICTSSNLIYLFLKTEDEAFVVCENGIARSDSLECDQVDDSGNVTVKRRHVLIDSAFKDDFEPRAFLRAGGDVIEGSADGRIRMFDELDSVFHGACAFASPVDEPISVLHAGDGMLWGGTEGGTVVCWARTDRTFQYSRACRVARTPISHFIALKDHVLACSASAIGVFTDNCQLRYLASLSKPVKGVHYSLSNTMVYVEYQDSSIKRLSMDGGVADDTVSIQSDRFATLHVHPRAHLEHVLDLLPNGVLKLLAAPRSFPGRLFTVDVRGLIICRQQHADNTAMSKFIESICEVLLPSSDSQQCLGIVGANGCVSVSLERPPRMTPATVSVQLLALVALSLCNGRDDGQWVRMTLSKTLADWPTPSSAILCKFWCDYVPVLEEASRMVFQQLAELRPLAGIVQYWAGHLPSSSNHQYHHHPMNRAAIILAIVALYQPSSVQNPVLQQSVCLALLQLVQDDRKHLFRIAAVNLLGRGWPQWEAYVDGPGVLMELVRWLSQQTCLQVDPWTRALQAAYRECIVTIVIASPSLICSWVNALIDQQRSHEITVDESLSLAMLYDVVHRGSFVRSSPHMNMLAEGILKLLDFSIHHSTLRARLLPTATPLLFSIVTRFPRIAFHGPAQRLASGRLDGSVVILDGARREGWGKLVIGKVTAHKNHPVTTLAYSPSAQLLASYSFGEGMIKIISDQGHDQGILSGVIHMLNPAHTAGNAEMCKAISAPPALTAAIQALLQGEVSPEECVVMEWSGESTLRWIVNGEQEFYLNV